jgi:hypothetical protein
MFDPTRIMFNQVVYHNQRYIHPQLHTYIERDFYDRVDKIELLENMLTTEARGNFLILGERRCGKTSLLRLLDHHLKIESSGRFVSIFIPWQGVFAWSGLLEEILHEISYKLDKNLPEEELLEHFRSEPLKIYHYFTEAIQQLLAGSDKTVVIFIDEIDSIIVQTSQEERNKILDLVEMMVTRDDLPLHWIFTAVRIPPFPEESFMTDLKQVTLTPFSKADLDEMIIELTGPFSNHLTTMDLQRIFDLSGGWPYFAKLLLVYLGDHTSDNNSLDQALERATLDQAVEQALDHIYSHHLNDDEKAMMLLLALQGRLSEAEISSLDPSFGSSAEKLIKRHFVFKDQDGNYNFRIGFLMHWFQKWVRFENEKDLHLEKILPRLSKVTSSDSHTKESF